MVRRLEQDVGAHHRGIDGSQVEEIEELQRILERATLGDLLVLIRDTLNDRDKLQNAAAHGYRHANGFVKLTLLRTDACALRLHVWEPEMSRAENPHNHRWGFASRVVVGAVAESRFEISPEGDSANEYGYIRPTGTSIGELRATRPVRLRRTNELLHTESALYTMSTHDIHRINDDESKGGVITMVLTGSSRERQSLVYSPASRAPVPDAKDNAITVDQAHDALRRILDRLN